MAVPSTLTDNFDALLSQTLRNVITGTNVVDVISDDDPYLFMIMQAQPDGYESVGSLGERAQANLMYALQDADSYSGYDVLSTTPIDGVTAAFFDWAQASAPISINRKERRQNSGEHQIVSMLATKTQQSMMGIKQFFARSILQGNGINTATAIESPYTSAANASTFVDPLSKFVQLDPTSSETVGNINQSDYSWWRNNQAAATDTNFNTQLRSLENMYNTCSIGVGGAPNFHLVDQNVFEWYNMAQWEKFRNPTTQRANFPFDTLNFHGKPVGWSQYVPDVANGTTAQTNTTGSWFMLNTNFLKIKVDAETDFITTDFVRPSDQDASVAHIMWMGSHCVTNRSKLGVVHNLDSTVSS